MVSAVISNPYLKQQYLVKKWVKAKVGGFLVFEKSQQAISFIMREYNENTHFVVYECAVKGYKQIGGFTDAVFEICIDEDTTFQKLKEAWEGDFTSEPTLKKKDRKSTIMGIGDHFPCGSHAYEEIKLTRKIAEKKGCKLLTYKR